MKLQQIWRNLWNYITEMCTHIFVTFVTKVSFPWRACMPTRNSTKEHCWNVINVTQFSWLTVPRKGTCEIRMGKRRIWNAHIVVMYQPHHQLYIYMSKAAPKIPTTYHRLVNFAQRDCGIQGPNGWKTSARIINGSNFFHFYPLWSLHLDGSMMIFAGFWLSFEFSDDPQMILRQCSDDARIMLGKL